ncbi:hypothetical protein DCS_04382 [Drechmeria coniospora]|uniref:Beta-lactamase-related domain-containing protein n=1 Tax=Drechmeria coniospora TaxID=98403 RepID=A0A151GJR6_DRECN|nr:hypothetical protein DCS_04382 [Drechmeria coniospora]KYK57373.1 hypothetical protein DCS_04382 [Drechmeria coniospora]ODA79271.1 hypothetical protein RJ55_04864 [Drechmeria coniospora]
MQFSAKVNEQLRSIVDEATLAGPDGIPGATVVIVADDGSEPFVHSAGRRGLVSTEDMTVDHVFWMASCTKMLTGLACMQLVERGLMRLDDSDQLEALFPEWKNLQVLREDGELVPKRKGITLRMLLTHTAGFGYSFTNERLRNWSFPAGIDEFSGYAEDINQPLLFQPGEGWEYGINLDWAGVALERATGTRLNDYIQDNICRPLGLASMSMMPTRDMKEKLAYMHQRSPEGTISPCDHLLRRPLTVQTEEEKDGLLHSGGAGMFAKPQEYCRIIGVLLNDGTCPRTGVKLLEKATVDEMFSNSIPQFPQFGRQGMPSTKPELTNTIPDIYPTVGNTTQGYGLTFMLTGGSTGRAEGTAGWAGLPNLYWWADRQNGIGGMVCTQILPFGDAKVIGMWLALEAAVYQALKEG